MNNKLLIVVPEGLIKQANEVELALGDSLADANTFRSDSPNEVFDSHGNRYIYTTPVVTPHIADVLTTNAPADQVSDHSSITPEELTGLVDQYFRQDAEISTAHVSVLVYSTDSPIQDLESDLEGVGALSTKPDTEDDVYETA